MSLDNLNDLYVDQLRDVYDAEHQLLKGLEEMENTASDQRLKSAFREHREMTQRQIERLERVFDNLDVSPKGKTCKAMQGLIKEAQELVKEKSGSEPEVIDAGLIVAAQKVEHYEIAGYGSLATYAEMLDDEDSVNLLKETLAEEKQTDEMLNELAKSMINQKAAKA